MTQNSVKIAVTGGMGSGKSAVCGFLRAEGYPVFSCDEIYAELCANPQFLQKIGANFGDVLTSDGALDKKKLANKVFGDKNLLKKLEEITHPAIMQQLFKRATLRGLNFCEVPLLFEKGFQKYFDAVIVVLRDKNDRIAAAVKRDGSDEKSVVLRMQNQIDYDNYDFTKYYVINNAGNLDNLKEKTKEILCLINKSL